MDFSIGVGYEKVLRMGVKVTLKRINKWTGSELWISGVRSNRSHMSTTTEALFCNDFSETVNYVYNMSSLTKWL